MQCKFERKGCDKERSNEKKNLIKIMQIYDPHMHDNIKAFFLIFIFNNSSSKKNRQKQDVLFHG